MSATTNNTPSTEGKAPVSTTTSGTTSATITSTTPATTPATSAASTAATEATKAPVTAQIASSTTPASMTQTSTTATSTPAPPAQNAAASLPADYLTGGYFHGEGKKRYTDPALVAQAEAIGKALAQSGVPANAVKKMARTLKQAARLPYEAQQGALKKLTPLVLDLEHRKKAPSLLREVVECNQAAVQNKDDFKACVDHFKDIAVYLTDAKS